MNIAHDYKVIHPSSIAGISYHVTADALAYSYYRNIFDNEISDDKYIWILLCY